MRKYFNTTGPCFPEWHYMVPPLPRLKGVEQLIDQGQYFVIHAPRQSGKTTYLYALMEKLNHEGRYTALQVNIQPAASGRDFRRSKLGHRHRRDEAGWRQARGRQQGHRDRPES